MNTPCAILLFEKNYDPDEQKKHFDRRDIHGPAGIMW